MLSLALIDRAAIEAVVAPFGMSRTLPAEAYTSEEVFEWERRHFFDSSWFCAGRAAGLDEPGTRRAVRAGRGSILLVRSEDGELRAFYNVCRHRGHELLECGVTQNVRAMKCPYHGWVYGLDGSLKGTPHFAKDAIDRNEFGLIEARAEEWRGWVFIDASGTAPPLSEHVGRLTDILAPYEPERLREGARHEYVVEANWKIIVENYHECYHCPTIHPELCTVSPPDSGVTYEADGMWVAGDMDLMEDAETMSLTGESHGVPLRGVTATRQVLYINLWPNLLISPHPDYVMTHRLEPLSVDRTRVECEWLFAPESFDSEGFDPAYAADFWDITNSQDWRACAGVQRGAWSGGFRQGPLAEEEEDLYRFITMVAGGYLSGAPVRPLNPVDA